MKILLAALATLLAPAAAMAAEKPTRPNIVVIMADDMGYECVAANGGKSYPTPNLDKLAAGGLRFTHGYAQPLCTPSRVQLMTGIYNVRNYIRFGILDPKAVTFAQLLKRAGYATGIVGKWQLLGGLDGPRHFGFDDYCLWQLNRRPSRYPNPGFEINGQQVDFNNGEYGPEIAVKHAVDFLQRHRDQPFCLYYPMILPHGPFEPTPDSPDYNPKKMKEGPSNRKYFKDMIAYVDKNVGKIIGELDRLGLRKNTLVLFTGDNGTGVEITSQLGDRTIKGGKGKTTENGVHVPFIVNWPGVVPEGKVCNDLVDFTDILPTVCEVAGVAVPKELAIDGRSFAAQLRGEKGQPRDWTYCWYAREGEANKAKEFARTHHFKLYRGGAFYDLRSDLEEKTPLPRDRLQGEAAAAAHLLQQALDRYRDARPKHLLNLEAPPKKKKNKSADEG